MGKKSSIRFVDSRSDNRKSKACPFDTLRASSELRRRIGNLKWLALSVIVVTLAMCGVVAQAQQPTKVPRIGYLSSTSPSAGSSRIEAFRQGLRELGYVEGKNLVIEWRYAEGKLDRLPALAAELVRLKVDIIVSASAPVTRAAKDATVTIPIVMAHDPILLAIGFRRQPCATWWKHHRTGNSFAPELSGKRLELLKEIIPKLARVAVLGYFNRTRATHKSLREIELAAGAFKVQLQYLDVLDPKDIETAFRAASKGRADAVLVLDEPRPHCSPKTSCRPRGKEPAPGDIPLDRICGRRGAHELRRELHGLVPACRHVCRQDPQRR